MSALDISDTFALPIEAATARFVALGKSGSGKSNAGVVIAEELVAHGVTVAILDILGNMHGLRAAGTGDGLSIAILGGLLGDVPLRADRGAVVADLVASGVSAVIDLSQLTREDAQAFAADFFARLVPAVRESGRNVHVIVEEAESFVPQTVSSRAHNASRAAATVFARTARNFGIGWTFSTQRPQLLSKDVIDSSTAFLAMKMTGDLAQAAIGAEVRSRAGKTLEREILDDLPRLSRGEAWLVPDPDWLGDDREAQPVKFRFRWRRTFDSARAPRVGERREEPRSLADVDLGALRSAMAEDAESSKARTLETRVERVEVPVSIRSEITDLQLTLGAIDVAAILAALAAIGEKLDRIIAAPEAAPSESEQGVARDSGPVGSVRARRRERASTTTENAQRTRPSTASPSSSPDAKIGSGPLRILQALALTRDRAATRVQLAFLSGFAHGGGSYARYLSTLRSESAIVDRDDGKISITDRGMQMLGDVPTRPMTSQGVISMFRSKLGGGPRKMFDELAMRWPSGLTRGQLATASGYEASGGSFARYLSTLSSAQLIERKGDTIRLVDELFPTGKVRL